MSDQEALIPRVYIMRHGETPWAKLGRYTGTTEQELTDTGITQVSATATALVGAGKFLDPCRLAKVYVSPRLRAKETLDLVFPDPDIVAGKVTEIEDIAEWDYGAYEGFTTREIHAKRKERGLDRTREWDIWTDGCESGESPQGIVERLDKLIIQIKELQKPSMRGERPADVLLVAHGLILRCFVKRWLGLPLNDPLSMTLPPGALAALSYKNNGRDTPALVLGAGMSLGEGKCRCQPK